MWDILLDLLGDILELLFHFPGKPDYEDATNPFGGCCGCFLYWGGAVIFFFGIIILIAKIILLLV